MVSILTSLLYSDMPNRLQVSQSREGGSAGGRISVDVLLLHRKGERTNAKRALENGESSVSCDCYVGYVCTLTTIHHIIMLYATPRKHHLPRG